MPHSLPDGESSSLGMMVAAAAVKNAPSCCVRTCQFSGPAASAAEVLVSGLHATIPVAIAAPVALAAPAALRKSRRGSLISAMDALLHAPSLSGGVSWHQD